MVSYFFSRAGIGFSREAKKRDRMNKGILLAALVVCGLLLLLVYYKSHRLGRGLFWTAAQGICAFFAVNLIGSFFSVHINCNPFSLLVSLFGGTPGVIFLLLMNTLALAG